jgi:hypothetical protein
MSRASVKISLPHSWTVEGWPDGVYPGSASRGRYIIRMHKQSLLAAGALARVGRDLVVLGPSYQRWLELRRADVPGYAIAPNLAPAAGGTGGTGGSTSRRPKLAAPPFLPRTIGPIATCDSADPPPPKRPA